MFYQLVDRKPVIVEMEDFDKWLSSESRMEESIVGQDTVGDAVVSTVFLCADHGSGIGEPLLFETAVFENARPRNVTKYATWEAAELGHQKTLKHEQENHDKQTINPTG